MTDEYVWHIRVEAEDNLDQLQARIRQAQYDAQQLGAERAQRSVIELAKAQERAALSGMTHGQRLEYLRNEVTKLTPGTIEYYNAQTQLNNELNRGASASEIFGRQLAHVAIGIAIWSTFRQVQQIIQEQITSLREYSLEVNRFAAITDQELGKAQAAWDQYARIATQAGVKPMEAAPIARIAELTPNETDQTRQQFVRTVTQLEELTGVASEKIGRGLSAALRQAGLGLADVQHMGDLVANTLSRIPAANLEDVIAALQEAAPLAELWGVSFDRAFNILVEGAARAQESPEQIATSFQRLSRGLNQIAQGGSDAWERQNKLLDEFGINVLDVTGKLRPIPEILGQVAKMLPTLSAPRQQALLETVAGGSLRPEQTRNILGAIEAFNVDLSSSIDKLNGTLNRMTDVIDKSLGQVVKVMDARIEQLREKGDLLSNLLVSILRGTVGEYGGKQGAELVGAAAQAAGGLAQGQDQRGQFVQDIVSKSGGDIETARRLVREHNDLVNRAFAEQSPYLNPIQQVAAKSYANSLLINDDEIVEAMKEGGRRIEGAATQRLDSERRVQNQYAQIRAMQVTQDVARTKEAKLPTSPVTELGQKIRTTMLSQEGAVTGEDFFPGMGTVNAQFDATKMTLDEINQAKQRSIELVQQELDAHRQFLEAQGLEKSEIDAIIKMEKERLDLSYLQVRTKEKLLSLTGEEAARFQQAASDLSEKRQEARSNFQFRRLRDVDPSQFGQLSALTQMYDQFLTNIGSPEKQMKINLLMGEGNVFKTMTARMTALQLALEDLTKVEKAQLSGTWNLPSGATALVPISSLDIQRWNKAGGGGLSEDAIRALLGATAQSGDKVADSTQLAASRIIAAIQETAARSGLSSERLDKAKTIPEAINATRDELLSRISQALAMKDAVNAEMRRTLGVRSPVRDYEDAADRDYRLRQLPAAEQATSTLRSVAQAANVTVSALPIKAVFNANLSVLLNGQIVARMMIPIMYDMITRMTASTGTRPKGIQRN